MRHLWFVCSACHPCANLRWMQLRKLSSKATVWPLSFASLYSPPIFSWLHSLCCLFVQGRCVICGGQGISDAYYCRECTIQEKDRDGCPKIVCNTFFQAILHFPACVSVIFPHANALLSIVFLRWILEAPKSISFMRGRRWADGFSFSSFSNHRCHHLFLLLFFLCFGLLCLLVVLTSFAFALSMDSKSRTDNEGARSWCCSFLMFLLFLRW